MGSELALYKLPIQFEVESYKENASLDFKENEKNIVKNSKFHIYSIK